MAEMWIIVVNILLMATNWRPYSYKDLGVLFDTKLGFKQHIMDKVNKAYSMLGIIKRNFANLSHFSFLCLYKTMVRSHLEYAVSVWCPCWKEHIERMERVRCAPQNYCLG